RPPATRRALVGARRAKKKALRRGPSSMRCSGLSSLGERLLETVHRLDEALDEVVDDLAGRLADVHLADDLAHRGADELDRALVALLRVAVDALRGVGGGHVLEGHREDARAVRVLFPRLDVG